MQMSGFPCFKQVSLQTLEKRFRRDLNQFEAAAYMKGLVKEAADSWRTQAYDYFQYKTNGIVFWIKNYQYSNNQFL